MPFVVVRNVGTVTIRRGRVVAFPSRSGSNRCYKGSVFQLPTIKNGEMRERSQDTENREERTSIEKARKSAEPREDFSTRS